MPGPYKNGLYHPTRYAKGDEPHIDEKHDWCFLGTAIMRCGEPSIAFMVSACAWPVLWGAQAAYWRTAR